MRFKFFTKFLLHNLISFKFIFVLLVASILLSLVIYQNISSLSMGENHHSEGRTDRKLNNVADPEMLSLQREIEELRRIKASVNNELRELENKRLHIKNDITGFTSKIDSLKGEHKTLSKEVNRIKVSLEQIKFEQEESKLYVPSIKAPHKIIWEEENSDQNLPMPKSSQHCYMESCFDFSRCSLVSGFPVYLYNMDEHSVPGSPLKHEVISVMLQYFSKNPYYVHDPSDACVFVVVVGEMSEGVRPEPRNLENFLLSLPHWGGDGRNHILLNLAFTFNSEDILSGVNTGRAIVAQSVYFKSTFRNKFDIVIPPNYGSQASDTVWQDLPLISPMRRTFFLSYLGEYLPPKITNNQNLNAQAHKDFNNRLLFRRKPLSVIDPSLLPSMHSHYSQLEQAIVTSLKSFQSSSKEKIDIVLSCGQNAVAGQPADWALCQSERERSEKLRHSTFALILSPLNTSLDSSLAFQTRLYEALKYGAIPVILGSQEKLPFCELLHWESAAIILPTPRVTEIPFFLQSFPDESISTLRLQGRLFFQTYFGSTQGILDTLLATLRNRLQIPPKAVTDEPATSVFPPGYVPLKYDGPNPEPEDDEVLGPAESPFPSETYRHNYSRFSIFDPFNTPGDPFNLYPHTPIDPLLPSESKFVGSSYGFRPIGKGTGGDGKDFSVALGGNRPREQFTVVMLTYDRELVLIQALQRFKGLPFLNKVLVVWNAQVSPSQDLHWPDIGVPIKVVKTKKNSLNNRFLPYDAIETEAILSIDDDAHLRHDEIVFGFRVWREERSRVVGFPGRFHAWDAEHRSWNYNSNYSCELSMVLTGAAFFHKYYAYQYSYNMPQAIRDKVDEYMNCEDIAMNFLVAHITRKPPVKVTSRWTFRCPGCPTTLSSNSSHFEERHKCINFFTQVYGYMPLLYTQYRVDSVLFKTRISHDKSKCFKYI